MIKQKRITELTTLIIESVPFVTDEDRAIMRIGMIPAPLLDFVKKQILDGYIRKSTGLEDTKEVREMYKILDKDFVEVVERGVSVALLKKYCEV